MGLRIIIVWVLVAGMGTGLSWATPQRVAPELEPDVEEVIFAVRPYGPDGHYYANFGYYCHDPSQKVYPTGGQLCRLRDRIDPLPNGDLKSGQEV